MYPRSQFLNQDVWDTMTTAAVAPMSSMSTSTSACASRLTIRMSKILPFPF
jgi:hypothetical protein